MSILYVNENGASVGFTGNRVVVSKKDGALRSIPVETLEGISLLGKSQLTTQCVEMCLTKGIPVTYLSKTGKYFGRLMSTGHIAVELQRKQDKLYEERFALELSKRMINAKIHNQLTLLRRYARSTQADLKTETLKISLYEQSAKVSETIPVLMGYEGQAAKLYFSGLSKCVDKPFVFQGRSRRPPKDPFNFLLSLGYSLLMNEVYMELEIKGLIP